PRAPEPEWPVRLPGSVQLEEVRPGRGSEVRVRYHISLDNTDHDLELQRDGHQWRCVLDAQEMVVDARQTGPETLSILIGGRSFEVRRGSGDAIFIHGRHYPAVVVDPRSWSGRKRTGVQEGPQKLTASMPGKVVRILAQEGDKVAAGQGLVVVEAMKMQNEIRSSKEGLLKKLMVQPGSNVKAGEVLAIVE
ncbi:MAG TPA: biotin/lipoyl-containing protein, partial [Terriglobales bacterium]|nr:biotin/lipoyl-containing protein [Terriglobales bacterium]